MELNEDQVEEILNGNDPEAIINLLRNTNKDEDIRGGIYYDAFKQLEALEYKELPELVVKYCVITDDKTSRSIRSYLTRWLEREGNEHRRHILGELISYFESANTEDVIKALRTAWSIGYRDEKLEIELKSLAGIGSDSVVNDEIQGFALTVLASLGYPDVEAITKKLEERLSRIGKLTESDCWTAKFAATQVMIPDLVQAAELENSNAQFAAIQSLILLDERVPNITSEIWEAFVSIEDGIRFLFENNAVENLNLKEIAEYILLRTINAYKKESEFKNPRIPTNQILKANLPRHLEVFREAKTKLKPEDKEALRQPAVAATHNDSSYQTSESYDKEAAWNVILRLGLNEAKSWLPEAMRDEKNFTLTDLAEIAGYLQAFDVVEILGKFIQDETAEYHRGLDCVEGLAMLASDNTLEVLLNNKVHNQKSGDGHVYSSVVHALTSVCISLQGCATVWNKLRDKKTAQITRETCAYTIQDLSTFKYAPLPKAQELINFMKESFDEPKIFNALTASLHRYFDDPEILRFLQELGETDYDSNKLTVALASSGLLLKFPKRLEKLGFTHGNNGWNLNNLNNSLAAFSLYCLYRDDEEFEPAVIKLIDDSEIFDSPSHQILLNIKETDRVSGRVQEAILKRALRLNGPNSSDTFSLEAVARVYPSGLLSKDTVSQVFEWYSGARLGFLESLKEIPRNAINGSEFADTVSQFLSDRDRYVRRYAAKLLSDRDPELLKKSVKVMETKSENLRQAAYMVDAAFYSDDDTWKQTEELGKVHRESLIRKLVRTLSRERKNMQLANTYAEDLFKSKELLDTWHLGQAVSELGNEYTAAKLYDNLPEEVYIRTYLINLAKKIEKNMEKIRREEDENFKLPTESIP